MGLSVLRIENYRLSPDEIKKIKMDAKTETILTLESLEFIHTETETILTFPPLAFIHCIDDLVGSTMFFNFLEQHIYL